MNMNANNPKRELPQDSAKPWLRWVKWGGGLLVAAGLLFMLWQWANDMSGVRREAPKVPMIVPLPPPPPPPPEPEQPPEPEEPEEEIVEPEPLEPEPEPEPMTEQEAPSPADDMAEPMQMDADAQAGSDAFNIGAGQSRGMSGSRGGRLGTGTYEQYLSYSFQKLMGDTPELRNEVFRVQVDIWLDTAGNITRAELVRASGNEGVDALLMKTLRAAPGFAERPPVSLTMPTRIELQGRRAN